MCPVAFFVYLKSKIGGAVTQAVLYVLSVVGAYQMIQADCYRGDCVTQNKLVIALSSLFAGVHIICMLLRWWWRAWEYGKRSDHNAVDKRIHGLLQGSSWRSGGRPFCGDVRCDLVDGASANERVFRCGGE